MTEDEAVEELKSVGWLSRIPKEFHTKEFVIKCIYELDMYFTTHELIECGISIDYDIVLATQITHHSDLDLINCLYSHILTKEEIDKIGTILSMVK